MDHLKFAVVCDYLRDDAKLLTPEKLAELDTLLRAAMKAQKELENAAVLTEVEGLLKAKGLTWGDIKKLRGSRGQPRGTSPQSRGRKCYLDPFDPATQAYASLEKYSTLPECFVKIMARNPAWRLEDFHYARLAAMLKKHEGLDIPYDPVQRFKELNGIDD